MALDRKSNNFLLLAILVYTLVIFPIVHSISIIVFGLIFSSVTKTHEETILTMFGYIARLVTRLRSISTPDSPTKDKVVRLCRAIDNYPVYARSILYRKRQLFFMLSSEQQRAATVVLARISEIERKHDANHKFLLEIRDFAMKNWGVSEVDILASRADNSSSSAHQAIELLEHFVRDWSEYDIHNRKELFQPFIPWLKDKRRILIPGSGLGRFAVDMMNELPNVQTVDAIEMSAPMWVGSKYATSQPAPAAVYPFLMQFSYWNRGLDQLENVPLQFPNLPRQPNFVLGDFLTFDNGYKYDAVATLFFIDTAQNVFAYIDRIGQMLSKDGIWCNYGPIKWGSAAYAEFAVDELLEYLKGNGWTILETWEDGRNKYNGSEKSMLISEYKLIGWVAKKK